jgi:hypothetical protein
MPIASSPVGCGEDEGLTDAVGERLTDSEATGLGEDAEDEGFVEAPSDGE